MIVVALLVFFALMLVPRYRVAVVSLAAHRTPPHTFTMSWFEGRDRREILREAAQVDRAAELAFKIEKMRELRDRKRRRFLAASASSASSVAAMLVIIAVTRQRS